MTNDEGTLVEMGFSLNQSKRALQKTGFKGVQAAMDWLIEHSNDPGIDDPVEEPPGHKLNEAEIIPPGEEGVSKDSQPASLKCDDCGKLLRSELDAQAHAAKSGHSNFSESTEVVKPLTEEEKKEQLEKLQEKMKKNREQRLEKEKQDRIEKERLRRLQGKDMTQMKAELQERELKKLTEFKKREKEEERNARKKVLEQIERDKKEREAKFNMKPVSAATASTVPSAKSSLTDQKGYEHCKLQLRLPSGEALTHVFAAKEPLSAVRLFVQMNRKDGHDGDFNLSTSFPRKMFCAEDMEKPLDVLGLAPSSVLMISRPL